MQLGWCGLVAVVSFDETLCRFEAQLAAERKEAEAVHGRNGLLRHAAAASEDAAAAARRDLVDMTTQRDELEKVPCLATRGNGEFQLIRLL